MTCIDVCDNYGNEKCSCNHVKLVIVGGGPAGLTAAIYAARANLEPIVAMGDVPGGQLLITTEIENFPGFVENITGPQLIENMIAQVEKHGAILMNKMASNFILSNTGDKHQVTIGDRVFTTDAIILATGANAAWLGLPWEEEFRNKGISACATCDAPLPIFRDTDIYVVGG